MYNFNMKTMMVVTMLAAVSGFIVPVYASAIISGTITSGSALNDAKVTIEQKAPFLGAPEYEWERTDSNGDYSETVDDSGQSYTVAAMKSTYSYDDKTVTSPTSSADLGLSSVMMTDMVVWIVADDGFQDDHPNWETDARTLSYGAAEGWFNEEHQIDIVETSTSFGSYTSPNNPSDCATWLDDAIDDLSWSDTNNRDAKVMIIVAGDDVNLGKDGCASDIPSSSGTYPAIVVQDGVSDPSELSMHEISHVYGLDHSSGSGDQWYDVMYPNITDPYAIKNWKPSNDSIMQDHRTWYN